MFKKMRSVAHYTSGEGAMFAGNLNGALIKFKKAVKLVPDNYYYVGQLAECYMRLKEYEHSIKQYKSAIFLFDYENNNKKIRLDVFNDSEHKLIKYYLKLKQNLDCVKSIRNKQ
ncbi:MAG: hypothetical protein HRU38_17490 [Saccharospirillaceae bacterium]|nr:hypothetical protein [Pseudomonadales bacterium]NRB80433.1 hypothetical protein [Saccharospirillaceae bacterium]